MGCCGGDDVEHEEARHRESLAGLMAGPLPNRKCTDCVWLFVFAIYILVFCSVSLVIWKLSDANRLMHGRDHTGAFCGLDERRDQRYTYYPDLETDFLKDTTLKTRYGICVDKCPEAGKPLDDVHEEGRRQATWYIALPSFPLAYRCVPYVNKTQLPSMRFCAHPKCQDIAGEVPDRPEQVCGLKEYGTNEYWLLYPADKVVQWGWNEELQSVLPDERRRKALIEERVRLSQAITDDDRSQCKVSVRRETMVVVDDAGHGFALKLLTQYSGLVYRNGSAIVKNRGMILSLGLGGSTVISFIVICLLSFFAKGLTVVLISTSFVVLVMIDYFLFVQAGIAESRTLQKMSEALEQASNVDFSEVASPLLEAKVHEQDQIMTLVIAVALAMAILFLFCGACAMQRNFAMLVALLKEASRTVRDMPSLLVFPMLWCCSIFMSSCFLLRTMLGVLTIRPDSLQPWMSLVGADPADPKSFDNAQFGLMWAAVFSFLWIYFFHVAIFIATIAGAVAQWFFRKDPGGCPGAGVHARGWFFGRPILCALGRALRYHVGSFALGSLVMAVATLPRLILEFADQQSKGQQEQNPVLQGCIRIIRCCFCCVEQCLRVLTDYAYINVAVSGQPFCKSARDSALLFAKYPVQVSMDKMVCMMLKVVACALVPGLCIVIASFLTDGEDWLVSATVIAGLSFMVTRLAVGVYDVCVTTLFVCVMRDVEYHDGHYMTEDLSVACGLPKKRDLDREIEFSQSTF